MPSLFPNVTVVSKDEERSALELRYQEMVRNLTDAGKLPQLKQLENLLNKSVACKAMPRWDIERLVNAETATFGTYYKQITAETRIPDDNKWDRLRRIADALFFENYGFEINFAALSTNGAWLDNYGDGAIFFKENMIAHRTTLFEQNTAKWIEENQYHTEIPKGSRALWSERAKLGVAKLGNNILDGNQNYDSMILSCGKDSESDIFIEVHIYGTFSIKSAKSVAIKSNCLSQVGKIALFDRAKQIGFEVIEA